MDVFVLWNLIDYQLAETLKMTGSLTHQSIGNTYLYQMEKMNDEIILKVFYQLKKKYFTNLTFQFNLKDVIRER